MSGEQFSSNAEEIRYYIKQLLQDGAIHGIEGMRSYVERHSSNSAKFTTGMYTGQYVILCVIAGALCQSGSGRLSIGSRANREVGRLRVASKCAYRDR